MVNPTPADSFAVHLRSLQDFGKELQAQLDALNRHTQDITGPAHVNLPLGDFGEADSLRDRHTEALNGMSVLLDRVWEAISFAERVTGTVEQSYTQADNVAAKALGRGAHA